MIWRDSHTLVFFHRHPRLLLGRTRPVALRAVRFAKAELKWTRRELAETRRALVPPNPWSADWFKAATCVHNHESVDWHWGPNHHPGQSVWNGYYNGFQFVLSTWRSTFAPGEAHGYTYDHPEAAPIDEQYRRAFVNWRRNGNRFGGGQWPNSSRVCGVA